LRGAFVLAHAVSAQRAGRQIKVNDKINNKDQQLITDYPERA
jgi:hypothetical protein